MRWQGSLGVSCPARARAVQRTRSAPHRARRVVQVIQSRRCDGGLQQMGDQIDGWIREHR